MNDIQASASDAQEQQATVTPIVTVSQDKKEQHIKFLFSRARVNLTDVRLQKYLAQKAIQDINKLFFDSVDSYKSDFQTLTDDQKKMPIFQYSVNLVNNQTYQRNLSDIENNIIRIDERVNYIEQYFREIFEKRVENMVLEGRSMNPIDFVPQIDKVLESGFFTLDIDRCAQNIFVFKTQDIYLSHINTGAGIHIDNCCLGKFKVIVDFTHTSVAVQGLSGNTLVGSFKHPHVSNRGSICWGNASKLVSDSFTKFDLVQLMTLTQTILSTYNDVSPYKQLRDFHKKTRPDLYPDKYTPRGVQSYYYQEEYSDTLDRNVYYSNFHFRLIDKNSVTGFTILIDDDADLSSCGSDERAAIGPAPSDKTIWQHILDNLRRYSTVQSQHIKEMNRENITDRDESLLSTYIYVVNIQQYVQESTGHYHYKASDGVGYIKSTDCYISSSDVMDDIEHILGDE